MNHWNLAKKILSENKKQLEAITRALLEKETLNDEEIRLLLGPQFMLSKDK